MTENIDRLQYAALAAKPKANKYRAKPQVVDGVRFDSKLELKRWNELQQLQRAGAISHLERQPRFQFEFNGQPLRYAGSNRVVTYVADFAYLDISADERVVEDTKSPASKTPAYKIKRALFAVQFPTIRFVEVMK